MIKASNKISALIVKELLVLFRDKKSRMILIVPPIMQLFIFAFAVTLEVKNVTLLICNQDQGTHGYELIQHFSGSPTFTKINLVNNTNKFREAIDNQEAIAAIHIPQNFSRDIDAGKTSKLQVILDGRRSNSAQIVNGYIGRIITAYDNYVRSNNHDEKSEIIASRNWYNDNLLYLWFTVPSLVGILGMVVPLIITSLSIAREREVGTFDQLLVSPLTSSHVLIGKVIPAVIVGIVESSFIVILAICLFGIPFKGSVCLFSFAIFTFILSIVGFGLFISSLSKTQQQAIFGVFLFMVPLITLSGYAAPIENMPEWLQYLTYLNPLKYFLVISKGIFLKDIPFTDVWANTWPLILIGVSTLSFASWFFRKRIE